MNLPSIKEITEKAKGAFKRFPIALSWAVIGTFYIIAIVDTTQEASPKQLNIILTLVLGVSWLIGLQFLIEQLQTSTKWNYLKLALLVLLFLFYWHLPEINTFDNNPRYLIRFFLYLIAGHLFLLFAPFLFKWDKAAYWNYLKGVAFAITRSAIFSGVLYLGLILAISAVDALFEIQIDGDIYFQLFIFCIGIVNTWIYLSDFPKNIHQNTEILFNKALEVFVKYILIPLVILYFVILYAYGIKIVLEWELPKGWVSYLVTALALLGFLIQVIINPVQEQLKSWAINQFHPWFYRFLLPLVLLLFIAIFRRISDYGITENRYFVVVIAFWILGMTLFLLWNKKKSLMVLPFSLFVLAIFTSFGFWGASSVSLNSQLRQFKTVYKTVQQNNNVASSKQYGQLMSVLNYLDDRNALSDLKSVTGVDIKEMFKDTVNVNDITTYTWFDNHKVLDSLKITQSLDDMHSDLSYSNYFSYYIQRDKLHSFTIDQYQYFAIFELNNFENSPGKISDYSINYDQRDLTISLSPADDKNISVKIPLKEKLKSWSAYGNSLSDIDPNKMVVEVDADSLAIKLIFENLGFYVKRDSVHISNASALLFLKVK